MVFSKKEINLKDGRTAVLRNARPEDAAELIEYLKITATETPFLVREPEEITINLEQEENFIRRNMEDEKGLMLIATVDGKHAGNASFSGVAARKRYAHRCSVAIALYQKYCGLGLGRQMFDEILEQAKKCGFEQAELEVSANNEKAIQMYKSFGFEVYGNLKNDMKFKDGTYADSYLMVKYFYDEVLHMILTEFDKSKEAIINPHGVVDKIENMPKVAVSCFAHVTLERLCKELNVEQISKMTTANMTIPVYKANYKGKEVALFMSYVGAAGCIACLEDIFEMGVEKVILFGTCGVLDSSIGDCSIIIPNVAVRDEGTSFHYAPPSNEILVNRKYQDEFIELLNQYKCSYTVGKVWTTDAIYRETRGKMERRKENGCICVDMECSAVAALAEFREKEVFQFFYAADNLDSEEWDERSLSNNANLLEKDRIALLAMELAVKIG